MQKLYIYFFKLFYEIVIRKNNELDESFKVMNKDDHF